MLFRSDACLDDDIIVTHPEDSSICMLYHDLLKNRYGIKFADIATAEKFSCEPWKEGLNTFGSHGGIHDFENPLYNGICYENFINKKRGQMHGI